MRLIFSGTTGSNMRFMLSMLLYVGVTASISVTYGVGKVKRILFGDNIYSHATFNTRFAVLFVKSWYCASDQINHAVKGCLEQFHCSGTMLRLDFILTACHCVTYPLFRQAPKVLTRKPSTGWFEELFVVSNPRHVLYSELAILAGDPAVDKMTQRRHAEKVFPHPAYRYETRLGDEYSFFDHDIALVRVCTPFDSSSTVRPAPLLPINQLKPHWESIVSRGAACFVSGYGVQEDPKNPDKNIVFPKRMRYTWRYMSCYVFCGEWRTNETILAAHRCLHCSSPIWPRRGNAKPGDSGSAILCDGYLTALTTGGKNRPERNISNHDLYAIHCIQNAITPERLEYYRGVKPSPDGPITYLEPVDILRRKRSHTTTRNFFVNEIHHEEHVLARI